MAVSANNLSPEKEELEHLRKKAVEMFVLDHSEIEEIDAAFGNCPEQILGQIEFIKDLIKKFESF